MFKAGAKAIKHKQLNYFKWEDITNTTYDDLLNERLQRTGTKRDSYNPDYIIKSGELLLQNDAPQYIEVEMPKEKVRGANFQDWSVKSKMSERLESKKVPIILNPYIIWYKNTGLCMGRFPSGRLHF